MLHIGKEFCLHYVHDTYLNKAYFKGSRLIDSGCGKDIADDFIQVFNEDWAKTSEQNLNKSHLARK